MIQIGQSLNPSVRTLSTSSLTRSCTWKSGWPCQKCLYRPVNGLFVAAGRGVVKLTQQRWCTYETHSNDSEGPQNVTRAFFSLPMYSWLETNHRKWSSWLSSRRWRSPWNFPGTRHCRSQPLSVKHFDYGRIGQIKSLIEGKCALTVYKGWQMSYLWLYHSTNNHGRMNLDNNHSVLGCQGPTWRRTIRCHRIKQKGSSSECGIQAHMSLCSIWSSFWRSYPLAMGLLCCWSRLRLMLQVRFSWTVLYIFIQNVKNENVNSPST